LYAGDGGVYVESEEAVDGMGVAVRAGVGDKITAAVGPGIGVEVVAAFEPEVVEGVTGPVELTGGGVLFGAVELGEGGGELLAAGGLNGGGEFLIAGCIEIILAVMLPLAEFVPITLRYSPTWRSESAAVTDFSIWVVLLKLTVAGLPCTSVNVKVLPFMALSVPVVPLPAPPP